MTRLAILGSATSPYVNELLRAAERHESIEDAACFGFSDLVGNVGVLGNPSGEGESNPIRPALNCLRDRSTVLVRTMPLGSLEQIIFRMDCLQQLHDDGVPVVNAPKALEIAIDKWLTLHRLTQRNLPVPATIACQTREQAFAAYELLGPEVVVKPIFGGEGRGLMRIADADMAWRVFSNLEQLRSVVYLQEFLPSYGYDIRVLFVGKKSYSVRRVAKQGQWKSNVSQGASVEPYALSQEQMQLAEDARLAVGGSVVGVDLLPCRDGRTRVLEVNAVPGWRGLARALQVDIAHEIVDFCCVQTL